MAAVALNELAKPLPTEGLLRRHWTIHGSCTETSWPKLFYTAGLWDEFNRSHAHAFQSAGNKEMPEGWDVTVWITTALGLDESGEPLAILLTRRNRRADTELLALILACLRKVAILFEVGSRGCRPPDSPEGLCDR